MGDVKSTKNRIGDTCMNGSNEQTIGQRLKIARKTHTPPLSQKQVAELAGVTQTHISDLERGRTSTSTKVAELAVSVNVEIFWLATGKGEMRRSRTEHRTEIQRLSYAIDKLELSQEQIEYVIEKAISLATKLSFEK